MLTVCEVGLVFITNKVTNVFGFFQLKLELKLESVN